jgi:hypothetical protein
MVIVSGDIVYRLSGGAANANVNLSLGGAMSSVAIVDNTLNNLWDDVSGDEGSAGDTEYRCFYVLNNHGTLTLQNAVIWISSNTSSGDDEVDIALDGGGLNATAEGPVANESTAPSGESFTHPTTKATGLSLSSIPAGQKYAVWVRRTVTASASAADNDTYSIQVDGDSAA